MKKSAQTPKVPTGRAAAYIRVSTADQGERYSLPSQLKALRDKAARSGKTIDEGWIFQDAHTGKLDSRPAFDRLKALVKTGAPDAVYIFDVSRFARKAMDALWLAAEFKRYGVGLDFVELPYQDTPTGRLTFTQMAAVAEYLGEKIIEDSTRGRLEKLRSGKLDHGAVPDGYRYIDKRQQNGGRMEINPERAAIWQDIFRWRGIERMSKYRIAERLNNAGIATAKGGQWKPRVIGQSLIKRTYIGEHIRAGITVPCPAIVSQELFDACQDFNEESRKKNVGRPSNKYLLRGFVWCGKPDCGKRLITNPGVSHQKHRPYYRCGNIDYTPFKRLCPAPQIFADILEPAAWHEIWAVLTDPDLLLKLAESYYASLKKPESKSLATLEQERAKLQAKIKTTRRMMQDSAMPYAEGLKDIRVAESRVNAITQELAAAGAVLELPSRRQIEAAIRELMTGPEPTTYEGRRPILEGIRELRMTYFDHALEITGKIPIRAKSTTSGEKNWHQSFGSDPNTFACIPFILRKRVA